MSSLFKYVEDMHKKQSRAESCNYIVVGEKMYNYIMETFPDYFNNNKKKINDKGFHKKNGRFICSKK